MARSAAVRQGKAREEVEYIRRPKNVHERLQRRCANARRRRTPIETGLGGDMTEEQLRKPQRAHRGGSRRNIIRTQGQSLCESTSPREALKVVLSGDRHGSKADERLWHWSMCGRAYFCATGTKKSLRRSAARGLTRQAMSTCAGCLQYSLYGTRDAAQNWEEEAHIGHSAI